MIKKSKFIEKNFGPTLVYFFMQNKIIQHLCIALGTIKALFPKCFLRFVALKKNVEPTNVGLSHHDIELFLLQLWTTNRTLSL